MYHDAPCEAAVTVHRTRAGKKGKDVPHMRTRYRLADVLDFLLEQPKPFVKVALQFPDNLLEDAVAIVHELQTMLQADPRTAGMEARLAAAAAAAVQDNTAAVNTLDAVATARLAAPRPVTNTTVLDNPNAPTTTVRFTILADNTFGSCCPDEITAQHYANECIIHFGDACLSRNTRIPVFYVLPTFRLRAVESLLADHTAGIAETEAAVVARVVRAQQEALIQHMQSWRRAHAADNEPAFASVQCELVVVGAPEVQALLARAEARFVDCSTRTSHTGEDSASAGTTVPVQWCTFRTAPCADTSSEATCGTTTTRSCCRTTEGDTNSGSCCGNTGASCPSSTRATMTSLPSAAAAAASTPPASRAWPTAWTINGLTFPRFLGAAETGGDDAHRAVQFFLFVGAAKAPHLVHLMAVEQYNNFHYTEAQRAFVEQVTEADGEEEAGLYVVSALGEAFGEGSAQEGPTLAWPKEDSDSAVPDHAALAAVYEAAATQIVQTALSSTEASEPVLDRKRLYTAACGAAQRLYQRRLRQRDFNIETLRASGSVGILVASLAIEGYYETTMLLHKLLRASGKRSYILYVGHLNEFKLANFVDTVDCFVAIACPNSRESYFPLKSDNYLKPVVTPSEVLLAVAAQDELSPLYGLPAAYSTAFDYAMGPLAACLQEATESAASAARGEAGTAGRETDWGAVGALVRAGGNSQALVSQDAAVQGSLARLHERSFIGLDPQLGQTVVQSELVDGLHGIARGYADERSRQ